MTCALARAVVNTFYRFRIRGTERIPPSGGAVFAFNHQSFLDPILASIATERELTWVARRTLNQSWLYRLLTRPAPLVHIERGRADKGALDTAVERARKGSALAIFPEETRTSDGSLQHVKRGFYLIAQHAEVPVVPALIRGSFEVWPRARKLPRLRGDLEVIFGEPFSVQGLGRDAAAELLIDRWGKLVAESGLPATAPVSSETSAPNLPPSASTNP
jgi:1-acyl-sn-glycerol-3-phosphate acyltransferase